VVFYVRDILSFTLEDGHRKSVFENSSVKTILCLRERGRNKGWKNAVKGQHDVKSSSNRTGVFRSGRMRRVSHMIGTGGKKSV